MSIVEVYRFGHCLCKRFSPISTLFSLASSRAFRNAPHSRFRCRDIKLWLLDFLKTLDLALSEIYTRVFHLWKSVAFDNAWVGDSRPFIFFFQACFCAFIDAPYSQFRCRHLKLCLLDFFNMLDLSLSQIYTPVFHFWKCIDWDSV